MNLAKKIAVIGLGVFIGELAWVNGLGQMLVGEGKFIQPSPDGFGLDDAARYAAAGAGVLLVQSVL